MALSDWFRAARIQLYTIAFTPVLLGNAAAWYEQGDLKILNFLLSAAIALAVHLTTAFVNDVSDTESDKSNRFRSKFSGGSGVIVEGRLGVSDLTSGAVWTAAGSVILTVLMVVFLDVHWGILVFLGLGLLSGVEYSLPPFKVAYRGGGELLVFITYGMGLVGAGYFVQSGTIMSPLPWLLSIPVGLAVFSLITITQFPDMDADLKAGKRSLVIILGKRKTLNIVFLAILLSFLSVLLFILTGALPPLTGVLSLLCLPLVFNLLKEIFYHGQEFSSYMKLSKGALILTLWYGAVPSLGLCLDYLIK